MLIQQGGCPFMLFVERNKIVKNGSQESTAFEIEREKLDNFVRESKPQENFKFKSQYYLSYKPQLEEMFHSKCAFCETKVGVSSSGVVEHFRPKLYYPSLAYDWRNIYLSCSSCNRYKAAKFPIEGKRLELSSAIPVNDKNAQSYEKYLIIDPCNYTDIVDNPFHYKKNGEIVASTERGNVTINIYMLNRIELVKARKEHLSKLTSILRNLKSSNNSAFLLDTINSSTEYLSMYCYFILDFYLKNKDSLNPKILGSLRHIILMDKRYSEFSLENSKLSLGDEERKNHVGKKSNDYASTRIISKIEIRNFKSIKNISLSFAQKLDSQGEPCLVLVGDNGLGKSSILQAISLALSSIKTINSLNISPSSLIRKSQGVSKSVVKVYFDDSDIPSELTITKDGFKKNDSSELFVLGYGSTRLLPRTSSNIFKSTKVNSLFNPYYELNDVISWLSDPEIVSPKNFDWIIASLKEILQIKGDSNDRFRRRNGSITYRTANSLINIDELCDGYKSVISYTLDIMLCVHERFPAIKDAEDVVLIDEIENHLHPSWKIKIISLLRNVFPKINFIVTTHDPLCLRGTKEGEVYVLTEDIETFDVKARSISVPRGLPLENMLLGSWFNMNSTMDEHTNNLIDEHRKLVHESMEKNAKRINDIEGELEESMRYSPNSGLFGDYLTILKEAIHTKDTYSDLDSIRRGISEKIKARLNNA
ncbi:AAA family ATPase [Vibrio vulnificus]